jgi:branched-chain amino acid transport system ATP-binding protein
MALLKITNVTKDFGGLEALSNVSMKINEGDIISLIGPNGAGKTPIRHCPLPAVDMSFRPVKLC